MASEPNQVESMYDGMAGDYSKIMDEEIKLPMYDEVLSSLQNQIQDVSGPLLDSSCGSGHMLDKFHRDIDSKRPLIGTDLSAEMTKLTRGRLGPVVTTHVANMCDLTAFGPVAGLISFFALHHVDAEAAEASIALWASMLHPGGALCIALWEGEGLIDYGEHADLIAHRYNREQLEAWLNASGLSIDYIKKESFEDMGMDALVAQAHRT